MSARRSSNRISFCTDWQKRVITDNVRQKGWQMVRPHDDWNIYWSFTNNCRQFFQRDAIRILSNTQLISHFPNSYVLTRKDLLPGILCRYRRDLERMSRKNGYTFQGAKYAKMNIMPPTFVLPEDCNAFTKAFDANSSVTWIIKSPSTPVKAKNESAWDAKVDVSGTIVVSKFISNPLIVGGRQCDLHFYVLVLSFRPLKAYLFKHGICTFASSRRNTCMALLCNRSIQITNFAAHKSGKRPNRYHGGKWSMANLRLHLESTVGHKATEALFERIAYLMVHTLKAVQPIITSDRHCFECFEYDIMVDGNLRPWLIGINSSASVIDNSGTSNDKVLKFKLVKGILNMIMPQSGVPDVWGTRTPNEEQMIDFDRLIDEDLNNAKRGLKRRKSCNL